MLENWRIEGALLKGNGGLRQRAPSIQCLQISCLLPWSTCQRHILPNKWQLTYETHISGTKISQKRANNGQNSTKLQVFFVLSDQKKSKNFSNYDKILGNGESAKRLQRDYTTYFRPIFPFRDWSKYTHMCKNKISAEKD